MPMRQLGRITSIDNVDKLNPLNHASRAHIQAGNNPFG
jgi:hypothetical protein